MPREPTVYLLLVLIAVALSIGVVAEDKTSSYVIVVEVKGSIDYGVVELVREGIERAEAVNGVLVLVLDTPGGLLDAALDIVSLIRTSSVPVVGYVYPPGKGAWSAGTLVLLATHVAAMAPGTIIGSLQPIVYNPATGGYEFVNESKIVNPILEQVISLAEDRGRNVTAARLFVVENLNLDADEAYSMGVVELIARSIDELVSEINGYRVKLDNGVEVVIDTSDARVEYYGGSLRAKIMHFVSDPIVNSLLTTLGIMILLFSIISGHYIATPIGIMLLLLSLMGAGFNANTVSMAFILIGAIALAIELFVTPGFGVLGFSGIIMIALGIALMPFYSPGWLLSPEYQRAVFWIGIAFGIVMGAITGVIVYKALKARRMPLMLTSNMKGATGKAIDEIGPGREGFVMVLGEYWRARSDQVIKPGERIVVVDKDGPVLIVKKSGELEAES